jgi:hypothetical protein
MPTIKGAGVRVEGLDAFRRELRKLGDKGLVDDLKDANFEVASRVVLWAQARTSTRMEQAAAKTLRPSRNQRAAQVTLGGPKAPFAAGAEFGAIRNIPRRTLRGEVRGWNQFREWRGNGRGAGYFLYPAIRDNTDEIVDTYGDAIEKIAAKAFPD